MTYDELLKILKRAMTVMRQYFTLKQIQNKKNVILDLYQNMISHIG